MPDGSIVASASLMATAADLYCEARVKDYEAALLQGSRDELEWARLGAIAAFESYLDAKQNTAWLLMRQLGIDPRDRP